jgi:hypothetical protein
MFLRIDGLLSRSVELGDTITELLTHYHTDHINHAAAERCLREGKYSRFIAPYPLLAASMTRTFDILAESAGLTDVNIRPDNWILDFSPGGNPPPLNITVIGEFNYSSFSPGRDITVEMFRHHRARDVNSDSLMYRVTHKNVSYMLFGDFDDPEGLEKIFAISGANEKRRVEIKEEKAELTIRLLTAQAAGSRTSAAEIQQRIQLLDKELSGLITLKADIIKWPHHAHKFPDDETGNGVIRKMNEVVDPYFIIWQRHHTQRGFTDYIKRFDFVDKFLSSDDTEIQIISYRSTLKREISPSNIPIFS